MHSLTRLCYKHGSSISLIIKYINIIIKIFQCSLLILLYTKASNNPACLCPPNYASTTTNLSLFQCPGCPYCCAMRYHQRLHSVHNDIKHKDCWLESLLYATSNTYIVRAQYKPLALRLLAMITSVTASNTNCTFSVSVAQVWWQ